MAMIEPSTVLHRKKYDLMSSTDLIVEKSKNINELMFFCAAFIGVFLVMPNIRQYSFIKLTLVIGLWGWTLYKRHILSWKQISSAYYGVKNYFDDWEVEKLKEILLTIKEEKNSRLKF